MKLVISLKYGNDLDDWVYWRGCFLVDPDKERAVKVFTEMIEWLLLKEPPKSKSSTTDDKRNIILEP